MRRVARRFPLVPGARLERIEIAQREPRRLMRVVVADAGEMTLPARDVFSNRRFRLRCMERLLAVFGPTGPWQWERVVVRALIDGLTHKENSIR